MRRAIALAALADGRTHPNPMVGAIVVRKGRIVGEGFHRQAGLPHAEAIALRQAGRKAMGAILYVTLEPCCHRGRTPPCTDAIISAGIDRVVYGMRDPNPLVRGRGIKSLRAGGVRVTGPVAERECRALNPAYLYWMNTGRPYVIAKVGITLDGKLADRSGNSQWITNAAARAYTHEWRARVDGICVGWRTFLHDRPRLTVRLPRYRGPQPRPVILANGIGLPSRSLRRPMGHARPPLWVLPQGTTTLARHLTQRGHEVLLCPHREGRFVIATLLRSLASRGIGSLMVEGGAHTLSTFLQARAVQYLVIGIGPLLLGGEGLGWTDRLSIPSLRKAPRLAVAAWRRFGDNVVVEGRVRN
ncbi:MAG: bifunctional diaminohydroxyphosphoribosylaminopyrimidine deaminase/5-amino-6-(5-phosphoribosylamino)uracil reductase RibD [Deltaproteobacteria bacterium]|nr:bifunctional diaminohydroxyphosphoribosylaminopyrimidine deaminase/5-amino-6-(5-phosphoribosylamino)uracil reductase RibD [Deltaproteobacteria bacterium]